MEIVKPSQNIEKVSLASFKTASEMYHFARAYVFENRRGEYERSRDSILAAARTEVNEHWFLREYTWCVHVAGFSAARVSKFFPKLLVAHNIEDEDGNHVPATQGNIVRGEEKSRIYAVWRNKAKAKAVQSTRQIIADVGWAKFFEEFVLGRDPNRLSGLPFMGPALSRHLARNLGNVDAVKPDVHLNRLAEKYGFESAEAMCKAVSDEPAGMTDLVLWYAAQDNGSQ